jgi:hypothetical protein
MTSGGNGRKDVFTYASFPPTSISLLAPSLRSGVAQAFLSMSLRLAYRLGHSALVVAALLFLNGCASTSHIPPSRVAEFVEALPKIYMLFQGSEVRFFSNEPLDIGVGTVLIPPVQRLSLFNDSDKSYEVRIVVSPGFTVMEEADIKEVKAASRTVILAPQGGSATIYIFCSEDAPLPAPGPDGRVDRRGTIDFTVGKITVSHTLRATLVQPVQLRRSE